MDVSTKTYLTSNGYVEGVQLKWNGFGLLLAAGNKGFLACGIFDLEAIESFGAAAAIVESTPNNPIGNLERFAVRNIVKVNAKAEQLGIKCGMSVAEAFELIA